MEAGTKTIQITLPAMGESVTEGTILEWLKQGGDEGELDQGIVEVSTDKVDAEVPAPASGILTKILVESDETVPVGTVLGEISPNGAGGGEPEVADESAVEEAEHGSDAEESAQEAKEETEGEVVDVAVPDMGESVSEGTVLDWLVKVGDVVEKDQGLVEISTDKVDAELPSPVAGTVVEILAKPDDVVATGTVVCRIAAGAASATPAEPEPEPAAPERPSNGNGNLNATPVAARMASANGVDVAGLQGSGPRGRVTKDDVEAAITGNGAPAPAPAGAKPIRGP